MKTVRQCCLTSSDVEVKKVKYALLELKNWQNRAVNELKNPGIAPEIIGMTVGIDIPTNQVGITTSP